MAVNYATELYGPAYDQFARLIVVNPLVSQPNVAAFDARGIYASEPLDVLAENSAIISDARTIVDIIEQEFSILPAQGDTIFIPAFDSLPEVGLFEILDTDSNTFETTLTLRRIIEAKP